MPPLTQSRRDLTRAARRVERAATPTARLLESLERDVYEETAKAVGFDPLLLTCTTCGNGYHAADDLHWHQRIAGHGDE